MKLGFKIISTFFGIGFFPLAPGTVTSLAVIFLYKFFLGGVSWPYYFLLLFLLFLAGTLASTQYSAELNVKDPRKIVIDEACGQLASLFLVPESWTLLILCFFLFRMFDIIKPFPIKKIEGLPKGWGIMADDIMAAFYTWLIVHIYLFLK